MLIVFTLRTLRRGDRESTRFRLQLQKKTMKEGRKEEREGGRLGWRDEVFGLFQNVFDAGTGRLRGVQPLPAAAQRSV